MENQGMIPVPTETIADSEDEEMTVGLPGKKMLNGEGVRPSDGTSVQVYLESSV